MVIQTLNLAIRFILELTALGMMGFWGWKQTDGWLRFILALGIPIIFMSIWVVFNVPGDPSRSGNAPIVVSGIVRLLIELCFLDSQVGQLINLDSKIFLHSLYSSSCCIM